MQFSTKGFVKFLGPSLLALTVSLSASAMQQGQGTWQGEQAGQAEQTRQTARKAKSCDCPASKQTAPQQKSAWGDQGNSQQGFSAGQSNQQAGQTAEQAPAPKACKKDKPSRKKGGSY